MKILTVPGYESDDFDSSYGGWKHLEKREGKMQRETGSFEYRPRKVQDEPEAPHCDRCKEVLRE